MAHSESIRQNTVIFVQPLAWLPCVFPIPVEVAKKMTNSDVPFEYLSGRLGMIVLPWRSSKPSFDVSERMGCKIRIETARFDAIPDDCILHVCRELQS
jgi:hypothetical protein